MSPDANFDTPAEAGREDPKIRKRLQTVTVCPACGGSWFREVTLHQFVPEQLELSSLRWGCERGRISHMPMTTLLCLCGHGMFSGLGGVRGGRTPNLELIHFNDSTECAGEYERLRHDPALRENAVAQNLVTKDQVRDLLCSAAGLERQIGRLLAHRNSSRSKRGRHWSMPKRNRATKSKGRDWLAMEVQKSGLTFDEARAVVAAIFDSMASALKAGESVETDLGEFRIAKRTKPYPADRFGKTLMMHRKPNRVAFRPNPDWTGRAGGRKGKEMSQQEYERMTCAKCGSTHFWEAEHRQYLAGMYSSAPGGELHPTSPAARVRVCFCGQPVLRSSIFGLPQKERVALQDSLEKACRYREAAEPEHLVAALWESFASRAELEAAEENINDLRKIVERLATASGAE